MGFQKKSDGENVEQVETSQQEPDLGVDLSTFSFRNFNQNKNKLDSERRQREAMKLVRVQISCNDPNKREYMGEIFSVRNRVLPEIKKYIPFNTPTHVPQILLNVLKSKKVQRFKDRRLSNGAVVKDRYETIAYNIEYLPPLTQDEYMAIRNHQLAEGRQEDG